MVLPEVSQPLRCLCCPLLGRVVLLDHLADPDGAVESLNEVVIWFVFHHLLV